MSVAALVQPVTAFLVSAADKKPEDNDVVAGGWGALVFVLLLLAVAVLGFSLSKHLRKAQAAKDAGVFGDDPDDGSDQAAEPTESESR